MRRSSRTAPLSKRRSPFLLIGATRRGAARGRSTRSPEGPRAFKLSVNDFIIKAMAMALQAVPAANASWTEQGILRHRASDIAVAVALEGGGLHTPVIHDAEIKSLSEISNEMRDLAARARSKRLAPHEYQGGSTTSQSRHVRHRPLRRRHQPAASLDPRSRPRRETLRVVRTTRSDPRP
jgi:hypothetical protein